VLVDPRFASILRDRFGRHWVDDGQALDGRARIRVAAPTPLDLARQLAGWGGLVDVLEPQDVRERLAGIGSELVERYEPPNRRRPRRD
jgi:predicted DNA-binding transcriptional regulator YafY